MYGVGTFLKRCLLIVLHRRYFASKSPKEMAIIVHGGCGEYSDEKAKKKLVGCKAAAVLGYKVLEESGNVVSAVETAISYLEDHPDFNCGYGSVLNDIGEVEMDACIVHGKDLNYGGVFVVKDIAHPISLARIIMEKSSHCLLTGKGASKFAKDNGIPILRPGALVNPEAKKLLKESSESGGTETRSVGCCALDSFGNLAAGTSTGGLNKELKGRCEGSAAAGGGTYADNTTGAVSSTGHGESCVTVCLTYNILHEIGNGKSAMEAASKCLRNMYDRFKQTAGVIVLTKTGEIAVTLTSSRMIWASVKSGKMLYGSRLGEVLND